MKAYGGVDGKTHIFFILAVVRGEWSASRPGRFIPHIHWTGGQMGPRAGLNDTEK
jgi:hypothetical protein